jgi:hypothetical protein
MPHFWAIILKSYPMARITTFLLFVLLCFQVSATHVIGGELFYTFLGNGQYEVTLVIYRDINGQILMPSTAITIVNHPTITNANLPLDTSYFMSACGSSNAQVGIYRQIFTIGAIPATGYLIKMNGYPTSSRDSYLNNLPTNTYFELYLEAEMKPIPGTTDAGSSPRLFGKNEIIGFAGVTNTFNTVFYDPNPQDSVFVELVASKFTTGLPIPLAAGYSVTAPFGNSATTTVDPHTGIMSVVNPMQGAYLLAIKASSYRDGQFIGSSLRDMIYRIVSSPPNIPTVLISNLSNGPMASQSGYSMYVEMLPGQTLSFDFTGSLNTTAPVGLFAKSPLLANTAGSSGSCAGGNCATFTANGNNFVNLSTSQATFSFFASPSLFSGGVTEYRSTVLLKASTPAGCNPDFGVPFAIHIVIKKPGSIWMLNLPRLCTGDSVQAQILGDTTNLLWIPSIGVSNPTSASPILSPTVSTQYTVFNLNDTTQLKFMVVVDVLPQATLVNNGSWAQLPNFAAFDMVVWYYNGVPLAANVDSFSMPVPGDYFAFLTKGTCSGFSDTIVLINNNFIPLFTSGNSAVVTTDGMASVQFKLNGFGNTLQTINLALPDSGTYKTAVMPSFRLLNSQQNTLVNGVATYLSDGFFILDSLNASLNPGETYTLEVDLHAGTTLFSAPAAFPFTEANGVITVQSASYMSNGTTIMGAYPHIMFGFASGIGIIENQLSSIQIYPNPVKDVLTINADGKADVRLLNAAGQVVLVKSINGKTNIDMSELPSGIYIVEIEQTGNVQRTKLVKE